MDGLITYTIMEMSSYNPGYKYSSNLVVLYLLISVH